MARPIDLWLGEDGFEEVMELDRERSNVPPLQRSNTPILPSHAPGQI
jgi:hypothetical protein